jgi:hypothetical protein
MLKSFKIKNLKFKILFFLLLSVLFILISMPVKASSFSSAYVRLNNQSSSAALSGTVCAQPSSASAGTEAKVIVVFPSDFTVSPTASNWTTTTTNLPDNSTAWPGIGATAINVSGKSVTFSGNDLTSDTQYCFNFAGASSLTGSAGNDKTGSIYTQTNLNQTIDSTAFATSIINSNQISVTASVDPQISDLPITLESLDSGTQFSQNTTLSYRITYGTTTTVAIPLTIQAEWSEGTIQGNPTPSVDLLGYVTGSATNSYGSTAPVIDTVNRTITWTISSIPANTTGRTVTFKLKTNSAYTGSLPVAFTVSARAVSRTTTTPDQTTDQKYLYNNGSSSTSATSTPTPSPTPTTSLQLFFTGVAVNTISDANATIYVSLNKKANVFIKYGTNIRSLSKSTKQYIGNSQYIVTIPSLNPATDYYFEVFAIDNAGTNASSDIYTFTTAQISAPTVVEPNSIIVTSHNNVIFDTQSATSSSTKNAKAINTVLVPQNTNFQFKFSINSKKAIKKIKLVLRKTITNKNAVLAANTEENLYTYETDTNIITQELEPGVYSGVLSTNLDRGEYEIIAVIEDAQGNISQQILTQIKISNSFTVQDRSNEPIEGARVFLYIYNKTEKVYIPISPTFLNVKNPSFSNNKGVADFVLPRGFYKAVVSDIKYKDKTVFFSIREDQYSRYPIIHLEKGDVTLVSLIRYYTRSFNEVFLVSTLDYVNALTGSIRFFDLISTLTMSFFILITLFAFSLRHNIPLNSVVSHFFYLLNHKTRNKRYINGAVFDQYNKPVVSANVYLTLAEKEQIIQSTKTNSKGEFFFAKQDGTFQLMVMKKGYKPTPQLDYEEKADVAFKILMHRKDVRFTLLEKSVNIFSAAFGMSFEFFAIWSLAFEVLFIYSFGLFRTLPFLAISLLNITLWTLYLRHKIA